MLFHTNNSIYLSHNDGQQVSHTPSMHCYGCVKKCLFGDAEACARKTCTGLECYIWPDNNSYLVEGIRHYFECVSDKYISQPVVIIDFSHKNITYFLNDSWLEQFKNMRLILVTDKKMTAIAHYWFYNDTLETTISSIIFYDDSAEEVATKLKKTFLAKTIKPSGSRPKLSQNEFSLFSFLFNGWTPKKIAYQNGTSVKNTYAMKNRIERKLGVSITRLRN
ncbi:helix-turn-helix transcriptional regulator [Enterobacter hormaechei]|uniref:helix-turn-helix transcriptional regulator n=1 Tax=Enterobacter hormaechei TaxID=158836 RepID=UPI0034D33C8C